MRENGAGPRARLCAAFVLAVAGWLTILGLVVFVAAPTRDAIVFGSPERTLAALAGSDTRIIAVYPTHIVVRGSEPGYVRALYAHGALLVLPARATTCLDLARRRA